MSLLPVAEQSVAAAVGGAEIYVPVANCMVVGPWSGREDASSLLRRLQEWCQRAKHPNFHNIGYLACFRDVVRVLIPSTEDGDSRYIIMQLGSPITRGNLQGKPGEMVAVPLEVFVRDPLPAERDRSDSQRALHHFLLQAVSGAVALPSEARPAGDRDNSAAMVDVEVCTMGGAVASVRLLGSTTFRDLAAHVRGQMGTTLVDPTDNFVFVSGTEVMDDGAHLQDYQIANAVDVTLVKEVLLFRLGVGDPSSDSELDFPPIRSIVFEAPGPQ